MILTSITKLHLSKIQFNIIDTMSFRAKALYNSALYEVNQHFLKENQYLSPNKTDKLMKNHPTNTIYRALPGQISQQIIMKLHNNFASFFKLLNKKQGGNYDKSIRVPKYKKKDDRKELIFVKTSTGGSFSTRNNHINIAISSDLKEKFKLKTLELAPIPDYINPSKIKYIEIIPKSDFYELHIKYEYQETEINENQHNWLSIDLGMNNLATITSNIIKPYILNGKYIKSINQKYNKKIAKLQSCTKKSQNKSTSHQIQQLFTKRGSKLNNEIHKITDFIVQSAIFHQIDFIVLGYNQEWKQNVNLGAKTNQNFVQIPFKKIIQHLEYKLQKIGIKLHLQEESYTSKCSYFDQEIPEKKQTYSGTRIKRGLFLTGFGVKINSDVNGSLNIFMKFIRKQKVVEDALKVPLDIGFVMNPTKISLRTNLSLYEISTMIESL